MKFREEHLCRISDFYGYRLLNWFSRDVQDVGENHFRAPDVLLIIAYQLYFGILDI